MYLLKLHILWKVTLKFTESFFLSLFVFFIYVLCILKCQNKMLPEGLNMTHICIYTGLHVIPLGVAL